MSVKFTTEDSKIKNLLTRSSNHITWHSVFNGRYIIVSLILLFVLLISVNHDFTMEWLYNFGEVPVTNIANIPIVQDSCSDKAIRTIKSITIDLFT